MCIRVPWPRCAYDEIKCVKIFRQQKNYVNVCPMTQCLWPNVQDMRYARAVFGLVNTSGRKDFEIFWESPWYAPLLLLCSNLFSLINSIQFWVLIVLIYLKNTTTYKNNNVYTIFIITRNEEHVQDAPRKRKLETQQRSMAVRSYIRSSSMQASFPAAPFVHSTHTHTHTLPWYHSFFNFTSRIRTMSANSSTRWTGSRNGRIVMMPKKM